MFGRKKGGAPINYLPPHVDPLLDRRPPNPGSGCGRALGWIGLLILGCSVTIIVTFIGLNSNAQPTVERIPLTDVPPEDAIYAPTATPSPTNTLDAWSATGTAIVLAPATATLDYCAWLTPTATHTATLSYTPDAWQATGTAIFYATNPPTLIPSPTATTPRSWCDYSTPTFTPLAIMRGTLSASIVLSSTPTPTPTATTTPTLIQPTSGLIIRPDPATSETIPTSPPIIPPTAAPIIILPTVAPATARPTRTPMPTITLSPTATPTLTPTITPTATGSAALYVLNAYCAPHPTLIVANVGGVPGQLDWSIEIPAGRVAAGVWTVEMGIGNAGLAEARTWAGVPELYTLRVHAASALIFSVQLDCRAATPTPTSTASPTLNPELTPELIPATATLEIIDEPTATP